MTFAQLVPASGAVPATWVHWCPPQAQTIRYTLRQKKCHLCPIERPRLTGRHRR